ncbi:hypothetical protein N0V83_004811 [Neocucurbitaria cava]|uniref:Uncharacterized protein n=1 Tax=Neocucurbitaria cava TaxID=798079 RepID=A0A9W8Y9V7_9PLEO|nr:hypothetical protein N0V83_004811 [Neocucurbitaria cava]
MKFTSTLLILSVAALSNARVLYVRQANSQSFTGALGGITATPILDSGDAKRPFAVKDATFVNLSAAVQRSCDQQFNACANAANGGTAGLSTAACSSQQDQCSAAGAA